VKNFVVEYDIRNHVQHRTSLQFVAFQTYQPLLSLESEPLAVVCACTCCWLL